MLLCLIFISVKARVKRIEEKSIYVNDLCEQYRNFSSVVERFDWSAKLTFAKW